MGRPRIGITADLRDGRHTLRSDYVRRVIEGGGVPFLLPVREDTVEEQLQGLDGLIFSGGGDPAMEGFGEPTHQAARVMDRERQQGELALLRTLDSHPDLPVLGICLGMQLMGLHGGGRLHQHLADVLENAEIHEGDRLHRIEGPVGSADVVSAHHQALSSSGSLDVVARAADGTIEAIQDHGRRFYLGVQWHPERTPEGPLGPGLIRTLITKASR